MQQQLNSVRVDTRRRAQISPAVSHLMASLSCVVLFISYLYLHLTRTRDRDFRCTAFAFASGDRHFVDPVFAAAFARLLVALSIVRFRTPIRNQAIGSSCGDRRVDRHGDVQRRLSGIFCRRLAALFSQSWARGLSRRPSEARSSSQCRQMGADGSTPSPPCVSVYRKRISKVSQTAVRPSCPTLPVWKYHPSRSQANLPPPDHRPTTLFSIVRAHCNAVPRRIPSWLLVSRPDQLRCALTRISDLFPLGIRVQWSPEALPAPAVPPVDVMSGRPIMSLTLEDDERHDRQVFCQYTIT